MANCSVHLVNFKVVRHLKLELAAFCWILDRLLSVRIGEINRVCELRHLHKVGLNDLNVKVLLVGYLFNLGVLSLDNLLRDHLLLFCIFDEGQLELLGEESVSFLIVLHVDPLFSLGGFNAQVVVLVEGELQLDGAFDLAEVVILFGVTLIRGGV